MAMAFKHDFLFQNFFPLVNVKTCLLWNWLSLEFGFDANETVALMGAHTLGQVEKLPVIKQFYSQFNCWCWYYVFHVHFCFLLWQKDKHVTMQMHPENSGHNGMWTPSETTSFNNKFYKVSLEWIFVGSNFSIIEHIPIEVWFMIWVTEPGGPQHHLQAPGNRRQNSMERTRGCLHAQRWCGTLHWHSGIWPHLLVLHYTYSFNIQISFRSTQRVRARATSPPARPLLLQLLLRLLLQAMRSM